MHLEHHVEFVDSTLPNAAVRNKTLTKGNSIKLVLKHNTGAILAVQ